MSTFSVSWVKNLYNHIYLTDYWKAKERIQKNRTSRPIYVWTWNITKNHPVRVMFGTHGEAIACTFDLILCRTEVSLSCLHVLADCRQRGLHGNTSHTERRIRRKLTWWVCYFPKNEASCMCLCRCLGQALSHPVTVCVWWLIHLMRG